MSVRDAVEPRVVHEAPELLWFLGTLARPLLSGADTGGRFALWEATLPQGAAPPLHSHPQDETFVVLDGAVTIWVVPPDEAADGDPPPWVDACARPCSSGAVAFAPAGTPHTFRVESATARMLMLSTPAGIDEFVRALSEPARWPWLQPPPDGPRVAPERVLAVERATGMVRHGPPPPPPR